MSWLTRYRKQLFIDVKSGPSSVLLIYRLEPVIYSIVPCSHLQDIACLHQFRCYCKYAESFTTRELLINALSTFVIVEILGLPYAHSKGKQPERVCVTLLKH